MAQKVEGDAVARRIDTVASTEGVVVAPSREWKGMAVVLLRRESCASRGRLLQ